MQIHFAAVAAWRVDFTRTRWTDWPTHFIKSFTIRLLGARRLIERGELLGLELYRFRIFEIVLLDYKREGSATRVPFNRSLWHFWGDFFSTFFAGSKLMTRRPLIKNRFEVREETFILTVAG